MRIDYRYFKGAIDDARDAMNEWASANTVRILNVETVTGRHGTRKEPYPGEENEVAGLRVWFAADN